MATYTLDWTGPAILAKARAGAVAGLTQADLLIQGEAQRQLYPGHGKRTGRLQRGVVGEPGRAVSDTMVRGRVVTKGVAYARPIERRYGYMVKGLATARPRLRALIVAEIEQAIHE